MGKGSSNSISSGIHHPNHQTAETGWSTFWKSIWGSNRISFNEQENDYIDDTSPLGKIWDSFTSSSSSSSDTMSPQDAFRTGTMKSLSGQVSSQHPRLAVRNASSLPLIMCWLNSNCKPHHFYTIEPQGMLDDAEFQIHYDNHNNNNNNSGSKKRKRSSTSYNNIVTSKDKIENTRVGHSFCFATEYELNEETGEKYLSPDKIIGGYRPMRSCSIPNVRNEQSFHLLTITSSSPSSSTRNGNFLKMSCCGMGSTGGGDGGLWGSLRGTTRKENNIVTTVDENDEELEWIVSVREGIIDPTPIDTSKKHYDECMLSDWPVRLETNWNEDDDDLKEDLCNDLKALRTYLPKHACDVLAGNTPLWINRSLQYGPKLCPVQARACCFHPGGDWLRENGMNPQKEQCVEVYRSSEYKHDRLLWGVGGLLLHEYSHAYHFKCLPDGYDNTDIRECYEKAMEEGLYDCVPYHCAHHSDDKDSDDDDDDDKSKHVAKAKAYACTNQMEYFAELSAAFLGGLNETEEFNKWYPFNRQQLKKHDPRAYKLLCRLWKVNDDDNDNTDDDEAKEMEEDENAN